ncbi:hypothetical protein BDW42DRAFT_2187 [Aspergillus taichungensis]|uniref:Uncharacterized protein n=1 Tax=Aspergillus taichungensis TaxID=482145 RepID=A0A2J5I607_9EURO|nr:hypothetical protein BDW42DRAFT_2187 [Aspergillus taichungensis]
MTQPYLDQVKARASQAPHLHQITHLLRKQESWDSNAVLIDWASNSSIGNVQQFCDAGELCDALQQNTASHPAVRFIVLENASPDFVEVIGSQYDIDPEFWADYAVECRPHMRVPATLRSIATEASFFHVDCATNYRTRDMTNLFDKLNVVFGAAHQAKLTKYLGLERPHYFRREFNIRPGMDMFQLRERVSVCFQRLGSGQWFILFVLDPPIIPFKPSAFRGAIRFPPINTWQGQLLSSGDGLIMREQLISHLTRGPFDFATDHPLSAALIVFLQCALGWKDILNRARVALEREALVNFQPTPENLPVLERLHEARVNLSYAKTAIRDSVALLEHRRTHTWHVLGLDKPPPLELSAKIMSLEMDYRQLLTEVDDLQQLIQQSFSMLMSGVSFEESRSSARTAVLAYKQSISMTRLTTLAFIYVPMSFVCGIFGMNLQELNNSGHPVWVFFAVLVGVMAMSSILAFSLKKSSKILSKIQMSSRRLWRHIRDGKDGMPESFNMV